MEIPFAFDNLAAQFSRDLADYTIYVIDVSGGDKIPRKGGPGVTRSDLLVINVQPDEGISLRINAKIPGTRMQVAPVMMNFRYTSTMSRRKPKGS